MTAVSAHVQPCVRSAGQGGEMTRRAARARCVSFVGVCGEHQRRALQRRPDGGMPTFWVGQASRPAIRRPHSPGRCPGTPAPKGVPIEAQRSGFDGERRSSEMSELSPKAEARDMELAPTRSRRPGPWPSRRSWTICWQMSPNKELSYL